MAELRVGRTLLQAKDHECSPDEAGETYLPKSELRLWLYVNLTNGCDASCPFCVNPPAWPRQSVDPQALATTLGHIEPFVAGISLTGGEPLLDMQLLEEAIAAIDTQVSSAVRIDLVTNGTNVGYLPLVRGIERLATIHVSRHAVDDETNRRLMAWATAPSANELAKAFALLPDPRCTVLNCVLQKGGIHDLGTATEYLEMAAGINAANVSFISMIEANGYCSNNHVSPEALGLERDARVSIWNRFFDHDFCRCSTGDYRAQGRYVRFYYRCPRKANPASHCRQLVFGPDNVLRQGFGNAPEVVL